MVEIEEKYDLGKEEMEEGFGDDAGGSLNVDTSSDGEEF